MSYPQDPYQPQPEWQDPGYTAPNQPALQPSPGGYPPSPAPYAPAAYPPPQAYAGYPPAGPYPQQPYGGYGYQAPYNPKAGTTNGFAIAGFVLCLLGGSLLGVVFAIVALSQIPRNQQKGQGLAIAALVITAVWIVIGFTAGIIPAFIEGFSQGYSS